MPSYAGPAWLGMGLYRFITLFTIGRGLFVVFGSVHRALDDKRESRMLTGNTPEFGAYMC